jgi:hypothetical protein
MRSTTLHLPRQERLILSGLARGVVLSWKDCLPVFLRIVRLCDDTDTEVNFQA